MVLNPEHHRKVGVSGHPNQALDPMPALQWRIRQRFQRSGRRPSLRASVSQRRLRAGWRAPLPEGCWAQSGLLVDLVDAVRWLNSYYPEIESYFDAPKSLDELRRLASPGQPGYHVHHIVERASALEDGFPKSLVDGPENLVRVPKYKHQEITGWFARGNKQ